MFALRVYVKSLDDLNKKVTEFLYGAPEYELCNVQYLGNYRKDEVYLVVYKEACHGNVG